MRTNWHNSLPCERLVIKVHNLEFVLLLASNIIIETPENLETTMSTIIISSEI